MCCPLAVVAAAGELLLRSLSSALPSGVLRHIHTSHFKRYTSHVTPPTLHLTLHTSRVRRLFLSPLTPPLSSLVCYVTCTRHTSYLTRCAGAPAAPLSPKFLPPHSSALLSGVLRYMHTSQVTRYTSRLTPHTSHRTRLRRLFLSLLTPPLSSLVCYVTCSLARLLRTLRSLYTLERLAASLLFFCQKKAFVGQGG